MSYCLHSRAMYVKIGQRLAKDMLSYRRFVGLGVFGIAMADGEISYLVWITYQYRITDSRF